MSRKSWLRSLVGVVVISGMYLMTPSLDAGIIDSCTNLDADDYSSMELASLDAQLLELTDLDPFGSIDPVASSKRMSGLWTSPTGVNGRFGKMGFGSNPIAVSGSSQGGSSQGGSSQGGSNQGGSNQGGSSQGGSSQGGSNQGGSRVTSFAAVMATSSTEYRPIAFTYYDDNSLGGGESVGSDGLGVAGSGSGSLNEGSFGVDNLSGGSLSDICLGGRNPGAGGGSLNESSLGLVDAGFGSLSNVEFGSGSPGRGGFSDVSLVGDGNFSGGRIGTAAVPEPASIAIWSLVAAGAIPLTRRRQSPRR